VYIDNGIYDLAKIAFFWNPAKTACLFAKAKAFTPTDLTVFYGFITDTALMETLPYFIGY
jgi:hypothetical protein